MIFQNINHAYNILKELIIINKDDIDSDDPLDANDYNYYILNFINFLINYYSNSINNSNLEENINNIKHYANSHIQTILVNLLDNFSIVILEDLYIFLSKYKKKVFVKIMLYPLIL